MVVYHKITISSHFYTKGGWEDTDPFNIPEMRNYIDPVSSSSPFNISTNIMSFHTIAPNAEGDFLHEAPNLSTVFRVFLWSFQLSVTLAEMGW